ncbi:MAG: hypothetical protein HY231_03455 [Acidobacteria bacterium]|nr:hypothetical protein [Acidobacteriota bacterium]
MADLRWYLPHLVTNLSQKLGAIQERYTVNEILSLYSMNLNLVSSWTKLALVQLPELFPDQRSHVVRDEDDFKAKLNQQIEQLKVELDWLKKVGLLD